MCRWIVPSTDVNPAHSLTRLVSYNVTLLAHYTCVLNYIADGGDATFSSGPMAVSLNHCLIHSLDITQRHAAHRSESESRSITCFVCICGLQKYSIVLQMLWILYYYISREKGCEVRI